MSSNSTAVLFTSDPYWFCGVLLELVSSMAGTVGKQAWRLAALAAPGSFKDALRQSRLARGFYLLGLLLTVLEPPMDSFAMTLAPVSIVSACAGLSVAWNVLLAPCTLGEQLTVVRLLVAIAIVLGTVFMAVSAPHVEARRTAEEYVALMGRRNAVVYYALIGGLTAFFGALTWRFGGKRRLFPAALAALLIGNQFLLKVATELIMCSFSGASRAGCTHENPFLSWEICARTLPAPRLPAA